MNLDNLYLAYRDITGWKDRNAAHHAIRKLISRITTKFPRDNSEMLAWFIAALQDQDKKWFIAKILDNVNPVPKALLHDLVLAALVEHNPSSNKFLIMPAVKSFGPERVKEVIMQLSVLPEVVANDGVSKVMYWLPRITV